MKYDEIMTISGDVPIVYRAHNHTCVVAIQNRSGQLGDSLFNGIGRSQWFSISSTGLLVYI